MSLKKTVTCLIFYKLKKREPIVGFSAHYIVTVLAYKNAPLLTSAHVYSPYFAIYLDGIK